MTTTHAEQVDCPEWARYVPPARPAADYDNHPPGAGLAAGALWTGGMAVGDEVWIMPYGVKVDSRGKLWVSGRMSTGHLPSDDLAHIQRVDEGFRVLSWPAGRTIKTEEPGGYWEDVWVVEFPSS